MVPNKNRNGYAIYEQFQWKRYGDNKLSHTPLTNVSSTHQGKPAVCFLLITRPFLSNISFSIGTTTQS